MKVRAVTVRLKETLESLGYFLSFAVCIGFCTYLTVYPQMAKDSIVSGLTLCFSTLIPSMFPFLFISSFLSYAGLLSPKSDLSGKISYFLTGLPSCSAGAIFLGFMGGYPVGAKTIKQLYEDGFLTENQARRMLLFCVSPGPAFPISAVGLSMLASKKAGIILYLSVILANTVICILSRFIFETERIDTGKPAKRKIGESFVYAGRSACESMINVCGAVLIFSCTDQFLSLFISDENLGAYISGILEVSTGCVRLSRIGNLPLLAGVIAFGGLSVHLQIADCIKKTGLGYSLFFASRTVCAAFSVLFCALLLRIFPLEKEVLSCIGNVTVTPAETSFPASAAMLLTCFMFLIGDYTVKKRKNIERKH